MLFYACRRVSHSRALSPIIIPSSSVFLFFVSRATPLRSPVAKLAAKLKTGPHAARPLVMLALARSSQHAAVLELDPAIKLQHYIAATEEA